MTTTEKKSLSRTGANEAIDSYIQLSTTTTTIKYRLTKKGGKGTFSQQLTSLIILWFLAYHLKTFTFIT